MPTYDENNIFAKIIRGEIPSYKVFETEHTLAILDAFPCTPGHALLLPKKLGYNDISEMPENEAADLFAQLPKLANTMKKAVNADAVNILSNLGGASGQIVFHPHIHVIPRKEGDGLVQHPKNTTGMITKEDAEKVLANV